MRSAPIAILGHVLWENALIGWQYLSKKTNLTLTYITFLKNFQITLNILVRPLNITSPFTDLKIDNYLTLTILRYVNKILLNENSANYI